MGSAEGSRLADRIVRRPIAIMMVTLAAVALGVIAAFQLPVELFPPLRQPAFSIITHHAGASAAEIDRAIAEPLGHALGAIGGPSPEVSAVSRAGVSVVEVRFRQGMDSDVALLAIREAIDLVRPHLPPLASRPRIVETGLTSLPVMMVVLGSRTSDPVSAVAMATLHRRLEQVTGVAAVITDGDTESEIAIGLQPRMLAAYRLDAGAVEIAIRDAVIDAGGGMVRDGRRLIPVQMTSTLRSPDEIALIPVATHRPAPWPTIGDLATVTVQDRPREGAVRLNGLPAVALSVHAQAEANALRMGRSVDSVLVKFQRDFPGTRVAITEDRPAILGTIVGTLVVSALLGGALAVAFLFVLLPDWRDAAIVGLAVPVSVAITLLLFRVTGTSLNLMSLGGLALGAGMLTDAAIVMAAGVADGRARGRSRLDAAADAVRENAPPIIGSTLTTAAVFAPALMSRDAAGVLLNDVAVAVACAMSASASVALLLVPVLATMVKRGAEERRSAWRRNVDAGYSRWVAMHHWLVAKARTHPMTAAALLFAAPLLVCALALRLPRALLPSADTGTIVVRLAVRSDAPFDELSNRSMALERYLVSDPDVALVLARIGLDAGPLDDGLPKVTQGGLTIRLRPGVPDSVMLRRVRRLLEDRPEFRARVQPGLYGLPESLLGGGQPDVVAELRGDGAWLPDAALAFAAALRASPEFVHVRTAVEDDLPELRLIRHHRHPGGIKPTVSDMAGAVELATRGRRVGTAPTDGGELPIVMRYERAAHHADALSEIPVRDSPMRLVARVEEARAPAEIRRSGGHVTAAVTADIASWRMGTALDWIRNATDALPPGVSLTIRGEAPALHDRLVALSALLALAMLAVYAILAIEFDSLVLPFVVVATIPIGMAGAIAALWAAGAGLNVMSVIGLVMLAGILDNDAVVKLDALRRARRAGHTIAGALAVAADSRLRPILINSLTAIAGAAPVALGLGLGAALQAPLAIALIGGLASSTLLGPVAVSAMFALVEQRRDARARG